MANEDTSSDGSVTPTSDSPVMGTPASPVSATPQTKPATTTLEEALARIAELEHSHKNATEERDRHRKKLTAYEKAEQEAKDAQLSEIERVTKQHAALQAKYEAEVQKRQEITTRHTITATATALNFAHPDLAYKLLEAAEYKRDDDGNIANAEALLKKLLVAYPDLEKKQQEAPADNTPARGNTPSIPAMNPGRSTIAAPDSLPPGKMSIQDAYAASRQRR